MGRASIDWPSGIVMSKILLGFLLAGSITVVFPASVCAQAEKGDTGKATSIWGDAAASAPDLMKAGAGSDSSYETRALRLESNWGNFRIVRGAEGLVVGTAGVLRAPNVEKIVAGSRRAESEARLFRANHRPGSIATTVGAVTFVAGAVAATSGVGSAATPVLMVVGVGGMVWGVRRLNTAYTSLSRAVWWYNRDLVAR